MSEDTPGKYVRVCFPADRTGSSVGEHKRTLTVHSFRLESGERRDDKRAERSVFYLAQRERQRSGGMFHINQIYFAVSCH